MGDGGVGGCSGIRGEEGSRGEGGIKAAAERAEAVASREARMVEPSWAVVPKREFSGLSSSSSGMSGITTTGRTVCMPLAPETELWADEAVAVEAGEVPPLKEIPRPVP